MKGRNRWLLGALFVVALLMGMPRAASSRTLDDIIKSGQILIGIDLNSPPYGFQDPDGQPTGSEVETAQLLAKDFGVKLQIVPTTVANRVPIWSLTKSTLSWLPSRLQPSAPNQSGSRAHTV